VSLSAICFKFYELFHGAFYAGFISCRYRYFSKVTQLPTVLMRLPASSLQRNEIPGRLSAFRGRAAIIFAISFLFGMVWIGGHESHAVSVEAPMQRGFESESVVVSLANVGHPVADAVKPEAPHDPDADSDHAKTCENTNMAALSPFQPPSAGNEILPTPVTLPAGHDGVRTIRDAIFGTGRDKIDSVAYGRRELLPKFAATYRSLQKLAAVLELPRIQDNALQMRATIIGTASTYNPYRDGLEEGGPETASGETYDPDAWTAAIQIDLRDRFGGVRYGRLYQPAYALVESGQKQVIVRINDVGRLRPGRVLDLNERSMRYFDPFLKRGLIEGVKITLLPGEDWTSGPVGDAHFISFASAQ
jgi:rare lipoprotein A